ncbi:uncharacterized protein G2W53_004391 [Senna tora]|uniref:Uncharacterized protein n=1 Tax=Senna tora TaxID=362788 RepID=A0A834XAR2_9FABA|nr:uncharacterized protein G2W53_004391 [Senna tora]
MGDELPLMEVMKHQKVKPIQPSNCKVKKDNCTDDVVHNKNKHTSAPTPDLKRTII